MRVILQHLHLWLGLFFAGLLLVSCLTGAALVFYTEIDDTLVSELRAVPSDAHPRSWQNVCDAFQSDHFERKGAWRIEVTGKGGPIPIRYYDPVETRSELFAPLMLWLDPRDYRTIRSAFWGEYPTTWNYKLHWQLLAAGTGATVMGLAGITMLLLLTRGLVALWPRRGFVRDAVRRKPNAAPVRRLYDIHKLTAIGSVIVLFALIQTGVMLVLPHITRPVLQKASPLYASPPMEVAAETGPGLSFDGLVARAKARFPDGRLAWIETPGGPGAPVRIALAQPSEPSRRFPRTIVWLDPYSGSIFATRDGRREAGADIVLNCLHPIHSGEAFGPIGRLLALLSGIAGALLAISGVWRWIVRARRVAPSG